MRGEWKMRGVGGEQSSRKVSGGRREVGGERSERRGKWEKRGREWERMKGS